MATEKTVESGPLPLEPYPIRSDRVRQAMPPLQSYRQIVIVSAAEN
jgi:hypothetical protein